MTDIDRLIQLNVELEGALRVLKARPSEHALAVAQDKFARLSSLFADFDADPDGDATASVQETPPSEPLDETPSEVKEDEAIGGEMAPDAEPDSAEVPAGGSIVEDDAEAAAAAATAAATPARDIRRGLTLNDRFLFRRELFGGSDEEFNDTLDLIAAMHSADEAREYLLDDLAWDSASPAVKEFMAVVDAYFK